MKTLTKAVGPVGVAYKGLGRRYVRTREGAEHFGVPIGSLIRPDAPDMSHHGHEYTSYSHAELEDVYGKEVWHEDVGDGWAVRLMNDKDAIITWAHESPGGEEEHVVFADGISSGDTMRDWLATLDAGISRGQEIAEMDDDELEAHLEEYGWGDEDRGYVDYFETRDGSHYVAVDRGGDLEIGPMRDREPSSKEGAALSPDEGQELRDALDRAWDEQISGELFTDEDDEVADDEVDDEEPAEGVDTAYDPTNKTLHIINHDDVTQRGDQFYEASLDFTPDEARQLIQIMKEFEPMPTPPAGENIFREAGRWTVDMDEDGSITLGREEPNTYIGTTLDYDNWLMSIQSFERILGTTGW